MLSSSGITPKHGQFPHPLRRPTLLWPSYWPSFHRFAYSPSIYRHSHYLLNQFYLLLDFVSVDVSVSKLLRMFTFLFRFNMVKFSTSTALRKRISDVLIRLSSFFDMSNSRSHKIMSAVITLKFQHRFLTRLVSQSTFYILFIWLNFSILWVILYKNCRYPSDGRV